MKKTTELSFDEFDELISPPPAETEFENLIERAITRRDVMGGAITFGLSSFLLSSAQSQPKQLKQHLQMIYLASNRSPQIQKIRSQFQKALNGKRLLNGAILSGQIRQSSIIRHSETQ